MASIAERVVVGKIVGVFGIKGWLKVKSDTEPASNIIEYRPWYLATAHGLKSVEVVEYNHRPQGLVVKLKGIDDRDAALAIGKARIEIEKDLLPELAGDDYYWHQLIGLRVSSHYDGKQFDLGCVTSLLETGANDVLVIQGDEHSIDQQERLVPYVPGEFIQAIDLSIQVITVTWDPEF